MATTIKLKNSVTTTNAPTSLVQGEVAINITDKKVWVGNAATTPVLLLGSGADGTFTNLTVSGVASFADGTVSLPSITNIGDTNTGIFFPAADTIAFTEGGVESMRVTDNGSVGIGVTSPDAGVHLRVFGNATYTAQFGTGNKARFQADATGAAVEAVGAIPISLYTNSLERMRIDSSGNLLVGTTSALGGRLDVVSTGTDQINIRDSGAASGRRWRFSADSNNTVYIINQDSTGVYIGNGGTSWISLSDERHKDIIEPITNAAEKISTLRAVIGKYKKDEEGTRRSFLIAQDVQNVLPEAVFATDPKQLGLSYTDTIPLLVAAIQELNAKVTVLEAQLGAK